MGPGDVLPGLLFGNALVDERLHHVHLELGPERLDVLDRDIFDRDRPSELPPDCGSAHGRMLGDRHGRLVVMSKVDTIP